MTTDPSNKEALTEENEEITLQENPNEENAERTSLQKEGFESLDAAESNQDADSIAGVKNPG